MSDFSSPSGDLTASAASFPNAEGLIDAENLFQSARNFPSDEIKTHSSMSISTTTSSRLQSVTKPIPCFPQPCKGRKGENVESPLNGRRF